MDPIVRGVVDANYHKGGLKIQKLFDLDPKFFEELTGEVFLFSAKHDPSDVQEKDHVTNWVKPVGQVLQWSLFNKTGDTRDTSEDHTRAGEYKRFHHAAEFPRMAALVDAFQRVGMNGMRLNYLGPGAMLSPHEEHVVHSNGEKAACRVRFHIPVVTSSDAKVLLDGEVFWMRAGSVYFFNNGCVHGSQNTGPSGRYHIVFDMMLSKQVAHLMFGAQLKEPFLIPSVQNVPVVARAHVDQYATYKGEMSYEDAIARADFA